MQGKTDTLSVVFLFGYIDGAKSSPSDGAPPDWLTPNDGDCVSHSVVPANSPGKAGDAADVRRRTSLRDRL
jgi:hypothetical protein